MIKATNATPERYYALAIQGLTDEQASSFIDNHHGRVIMPCGAVCIADRHADQQCPNSGNCAAGIKECWVVKRFPAAT